MDSMFWFWLTIAVIMAVVEGITPALVTIWFMFGAVVAMLASCLGASVAVQMIVFVVISTLLLIVTRPLAKKLLKQGETTSTNADRIIGQTGIVTEEICNIENRGQIMVLGQSWSARSENEEIIGCGEMVTVTGIAGVKAVVRRKVN